MLWSKRNAKVRVEIAGTHWIRGEQETAEKIKKTKMGRGGKSGRAKTNVVWGYRIKEKE